MVYDAEIFALSLSETNSNPLVQAWAQTHTPLMLVYAIVEVSLMMYMRTIFATSLLWLLTFRRNANPPIVFCCDLWYVQYLCLLLGGLYVLLVSLSMVHEHNVKALWPMASLMTLSSDTCYGLFMSFFKWTFRLPG